MPIALYDLAGQGDRRFSPYCWRIRMSLAHKGLDYETRPTGFSKIASICGGGYKTVPVIDDGGKVMSESFDIARRPSRDALPFRGQHLDVLGNVAVV